MRNFSDLQNEPRLEKFLDSPFGTLYTISDASGIPKVMVRRFDSDLPAKLVKPFTELVQATQQWLEIHPELGRLVKVEQPIERGSDFVSRPYHIYYTSTDAYVDWEDSPEPPIELEQMRNAFLKAIGKSVGPRDALIEMVLTRSLLEPTGKTYFNESIGQFIVVEPKLTREDVERWAALSARLGY
jgi:hypothetical protein